MWSMLSCDEEWVRAVQLQWSGADGVNLSSQPDNGLTLSALIVAA